MTTRDGGDGPAPEGLAGAAQADPRSPEAERRKQRLAEALRENLRRRKAQARIRREAGDG